MLNDGVVKCNAADIDSLCMLYITVDSEVNEREFDAIRLITVWQSLKGTL